MRYSRRDFAKLSLGALPAAALLMRPSAVFAATKPNSVINGVHIGTITYSYRSMPDQSAEAILRYVVDSGIDAIEFMGGPVEAFAGAPQVFRVPFGTAPNAEQQAQLREAAQHMRAWRTSVSMDRFKALRKMFNDAGVTIYAWKQLAPDMSDAEMDYVFNVADALGCTHTTLELVDDPAQLKRIGQFAEKHRIYAAYHTHLQGSLTAFDQAFAASNSNRANVDLGHYVAAGGDPLQFLNKFHDRIASFHLKDRQTPAHGAGNLAWGKGDTPIREMLQLVRKNGWTMPVTIEQEYDIPAGSDAVKEVTKCLAYCRQALV